MAGVKASIRDSFAGVIDMFITARLREKKDQRRGHPRAVGDADGLSETRMLR